MEKERKSGSVDWRSILAKYLLSLIYFFKVANHKIWETEIFVANS